MPISLIMLGVFIIFLNFRVGQKTFSEFGISTLTLNILSILAFILLIVKPLNFYNIAYVSLGGFFVFNLFAIYLLTFLKNSKQLYIIAQAFFITIALYFLLNLFLPFMQEQMFNFSTMLVGLIIGGIVFFLVKDLKSAFITIFLSSTASSILYFLANRKAFFGEILFLGNGNFFEISIIAFGVCYLLKSLNNSDFFIKIRRNV